jgi:hypothetical protein
VRCADGWKGCQDDTPLDIRFEKLTPQPGVARLAFSKKILVIGLEFAKINPIQSVAIAGSAAHTHHHLKKLPSPSSRDVWEIFSVSFARSPFHLLTGSRSFSIENSL